MLKGIFAYDLWDDNQVREINNLSCSQCQKDVTVASLPLPHDGDLCMTLPYL